MLVEGAHNEKGDMRTKAIHGIGLLEGEPKAVEIAEWGLADNEPQVRAAAARVLGEMSSSKSVPKLIEATKDQKLSVAIGGGPFAHRIEGERRIRSVLRGYDRRTKKRRRDQKAMG